MSDFAEKTEQPTQRKLDEALKKGQIPRSAEVQTVAVLAGGLIAIAFAGREIWGMFVNTSVMTFSHLHDTALNTDSLQAYAIAGVFFMLKCAGPIVIGTALGGVLAGIAQNKFNTASEVLTPNWERLNPVEGFKRVFTFKNTVPTLISVVKLAVIIAITYNDIRSVLLDPVFTTSVGVGRLAEFLAEAAMRIFLRVILALGVVAAADYGYQFWKNKKDMMMTKEEVKEEMKSSEGNPEVKKMRSRKRGAKKAKMLADVAQADVVVTNPTHIAVALRYNRKTMKAPRVVAKGIRLNALQIREIAKKHQIPIIENKPLARMLFKHAKVGGEVPAQLFAAVAEVLAWVYRVNRYRYYAEQNQA